MTPMARPMFSVFVRYLVRFLLPASRRWRRSAGDRAAYVPTYPVGNSRPVALDSLTTLT